MYVSPPNSIQDFLYNFNLIELTCEIHASLSLYLLQWRLEFQSNKHHLFHLRFQRRIQDFPEGAPTLKGRSANLLFGHFFMKTARKQRKLFLTARRNFVYVHAPPVSCFALENVLKPLKCKVKKPGLVKRHQIPTTIISLWLLVTGKVTTTLDLPLFLPPLTQLLTSFSHINRESSKREQWMYESRPMKKIRLKWWLPKFSSSNLYFYHYAKHVYNKL